MNNNRKIEGLNTQFVQAIAMLIFLRMNSPKEIEGRLVKPVYYVVAIDNMGNMKVRQ